MTEWTTLADIATAAGLPPGAGEVLGHMKTMPLASADDLAGVMKRSDTSVLANLRQLREANVVEAVDLGCTRRQRQRWYFTDALLHRADLTGTTWHEEHTRCRLLDILPALENAYAVAGAVELLGPFEQFQWLESRDVRGPTCDAAVRYSHGWMPIFWCGSLLSQSDIADRWARFPVDTQALAVGDPRPWPGLVCMVVQDEWERELVTRVLEDYGLTGRAVVRCVSDRTVTGPSTAPASRGWLYQPAPRMPRRPVSWDRSLAKSPWAGAGGLLLWRALEAVTQWPGGQQWFIKDLLEEPRSQHRVKNGLHRLAELALIVRVGGRPRRAVFPQHPRGGPASRPGPNPWVGRPHRDPVVAVAGGLSYDIETPDFSGPRGRPAGPAGPPRGPGMARGQWGAALGAPGEPWWYSARCHGPPAGRPLRGGLGISRVRTECPGPCQSGGQDPWVRLPQAARLLPSHAGLLG